MDRASVEFLPLWVIGEGGIGKTKLVQESLFTAIKNNYRVELINNSVPYKDTPLFAVRTLLNQLLKLNFTGVDLTSVLSSLEVLNLSSLEILAIDKLMAVDHEAIANWRIPSDYKIAAIDGAFRKIVEHIASIAPLLVVIENYHNCDSESRRCLEVLIGYSQIAKLHLKFLITTRPQLTPKNLSGQSLLYLKPLNDDESSLFIEHHIERKLFDESPDIIRDILSRSKGLPLALREFVRAVNVSETGDIFQQDFPLALEPLLRKRFEQLSSTEKKLIHDCCILGYEFPFSLLKTVSDLEENNFEIALNSLIEKKLLVKTSAKTLSFDHQVFQDVCYKSIIQPERRKRHLKVYETYMTLPKPEGLSSQSSYIDPQHLAYHAEKSDQLELALDHLWTACGLAMGQSAISTVRSLYYRAIKICDKLGPSAEKRRVLFSLKAYDAFYQLTYDAELLGAFEQALQSSTCELTEAETALIHCNISVAKWIGGNSFEAVESVNLAQSIARKMDYFPMICYAEFSKANIEFALGDVKPAVDRLLSLIEPFEKGSAAKRFGQTVILPSVMYQTFASWYAVELGDISLSKNLWEKARHTADREDHGYSIALCDLALGYRLLREERFDKAADVLLRCHDLCFKGSYLGIIPMVSAWSSLALMEIGDIKNAERLLSEELATGRIERVRNSCRFYSQHYQSSIKLAQQCGMTALIRKLELALGKV